MSRRWEVVVIGGGQAGLAMGYHLARQGVSYTILDGAPAAGHSWRSRWDSLTLFTPARYSALPGLSFPGDPERLPARDEVADYLESYAAAFQLPVRWNTRVSALRPVPHGFVIEAEGERYEADQVVVATGPFQRPWIPDFAARLSDSVVQLHSSGYRTPEELPPGDVLVVGGGNSGVQIAAELSRSRRVSLSVGSRMPYLPERILGRSLFWWLERAGVYGITVGSRLGRRLSRTDTLIGTSLRRLRREYGVEVLGRAIQAKGDAVVTETGERIRPVAIVWATGFRPDYRWIDAPVLGPRGAPLHSRGVTSVPGLYFLGLPWLHTRGSALIGWVGDDAAHLAIVIRSRGPGGSLHARRAGVAA